MKIITAIPMTLHKFHLDQNITAISQAFTDGYKVTFEDGHVSWCPKDIYDRLNKTDEKTPAIPTTLA